MCPAWTQEVKTVGEIFTLPFAGENEVFSIFGNRDCNGDGTPAEVEADDTDAAQS